MRKLPTMRLRNVQTNNIFTLTNREQIGMCLKQTFNSAIPTERWVEEKKREEFVSRSVPRFKVCTKKIKDKKTGEEYEAFDCDPSLVDLIPKEEHTMTIRERMLNVEPEPETLETLKRFCYEKGIHFQPNIGFEKLKAKVDTWKELNAELV